jgi:hypothetical protein
MSPRTILVTTWICLGKKSGNALAHTDWILGLWLFLGMLQFALLLVCSLSLSLSSPPFQPPIFCALGIILSRDCNIAWHDSCCLGTRKDGTSSPLNWTIHRKNPLVLLVTHPSFEPTLWLVPQLGSSPHPCAQYYLNKQNGNPTASEEREEPASHPNLCTAF